MKAQGEFPLKITACTEYHLGLQECVFVSGLGIEFSLPLVEQRRRSRERPQQGEEEEEERKTEQK